MRKVANEFGINVSTVSRHVRKWAEQNAELRGDLTTAREVELARIDEMIGKGSYHDRIQLLDRKYRLMGLYASGPQVVVGIGVQQGQQANQPRVIEGVARDISDDTA